MHFNALTRKNSKEGITNMKDTLEIRWHGRGGQGAKTAALLLAEVAFKQEKMHRDFQNMDLKEWELQSLLTTESVTTQFAYIQTFMIHSM